MDEYRLIQNDITKLIESNRIRLIGQTELLSKASRAEAQITTLTRQVQDANADAKRFNKELEESKAIYNLNQGEISNLKDRLRQMNDFIEGKVVSQKTLSYP